MPVLSFAFSNILMSELHDVIILVSLEVFIRQTLPYTRSFILPKDSIFFFFLFFLCVMRHCIRVLMYVYVHMQRSGVKAKCFNDHFPLYFSVISIYLFIVCMNTCHGTWKSEDDFQKLVFIIEHARLYKVFNGKMMLLHFQRTMIIVHQEKVLAEPN